MTPDNETTGTRGRGSGRRAPGRTACAEAAWKLLTEGNALARLGLGATTLAEAARAEHPNGFVAENTATHHLVTGNVLHDVARKLVETMATSGFENSADYKLTARQIPDLDGANLTQIARQARRLIGTALKLDLEDSRTAERVWYSLVAICDLAPDALGRNVDLPALLREGHDRNQDAYQEAYDDFCKMTGRTYVRGRDFTMQSLNAYLEGVSVQRRYGRGPQTVEEVVDAAVRIFWATTRPLDTPEHDIDEELFGVLAG